MVLAWREFAYWMTRYRHTWRASAVFSVLNPLLFLVGIGAGLGRLVDEAGGAPGGVSYLAFVAPGILAASAMQTSFVESANSVYLSVRTQRNYLIAAAGPLRPGHIMVGHLGFVVFRAFTTSAVFAIVMVAVQASTWDGALWTVLAATLTGLAFAAPTAAWAVTVRRSSTLSMFFRFAIFPLYMLSGTFFAVSQLPPVLREIAYASPLWQGVELCRSLSLHTATPGGTATHVAYLTVMAGAGLLAARRTYRRELHA